MLEVLVAMLSPQHFHVAEELKDVTPLRQCDEGLRMVDLLDTRKNEQWSVQYASRLLVRVDWGPSRKMTGDISLSYWDAWLNRSWLCHDYAPVTPTRLDSTHLSKTLRHELHQRLLHALHGT